MDWLFFACWIFLGSGPCSLFCYLVNRQYDHALSRGDVTMIALFGIAGPIGFMSLLLLGFVIGVVWFATREFWAKPIFPKNKNAADR